jgi:hypothetical protein
VNLEAEILKGLQARFQFRKTKGSWLQEGICPACGKREAFCAAKDPKIVRCGRQDRCGWEETVRDLLPDLFEDWSKRFPETETNPTATADAYLVHERCLDLRLLRGAYTQELYRDHKTGHTSATVRFQIGDTHWERLIDRPGRFEKKAHFRKGGTYKGHCWVPPHLSMEDIAKADEILIAEGIFDAVALCQVRKVAVSAMSTNNWPEHFLAALRAELERVGRTVRPRLVFAFDVGRAGVEATIKYVKRATTEGWDASAMQVRPDGEGTKKDWNDLLKEHLDWAGDPDKAPLSPWAFDQYRYNGAITIAETARDKARLMADHKMAVSTFEFRHKNRLWSCKVSFDEETEKRRIVVEEIANCAFRLLYRERDEIADETSYFLHIDFPFDDQPVKARFSSAACANSGEFKKRMMAFAGMWSGSGEQLDRMMRAQTRNLKVVEPIYFTGYSAAHRAWLLGDLAVREGASSPSTARPISISARRRSNRAATSACSTSSMMPTCSIWTGCPTSGPPGGQRPWSPWPSSSCRCLPCRSACAKSPSASSKSPARPARANPRWSSSCGSCSDAAGTKASIPTRPPRPFSRAA